MSRSEYKKKLSKDWIERGLCRNCGARPPAEGRKQCRNCLDNSLLATRRARLNNPDSFKKSYAEKRKLGLCVDCSKPARPNGAYCQKCADTESQRALRTKCEAINKYGGKCVCCGVTHIAFLTIDHINNDGFSRRKTEGVGTSFYRKLVCSDVDATLQVLCANCNMGKRMTGVCPHVDDAFFVEALARAKYQRRNVPAKGIVSKLEIRQLQLPLDLHNDPPDRTSGPTAPLLCENELALCASRRTHAQDVVR
jgi:hypothetical protein